MMKRKIIPFILIVSTILSFVSCKKENRVEYCELGIILPEEFVPYDSEGSFNTAYSDGKSIVGITRYSFVECDELGLVTSLTPYKFAGVYLEMLDRQVDTPVIEHGDVPYFTYTVSKEDGSQYFYMPTFYRTPYAYFVITFITPKSRDGVGRAEFLEYVSTVYILSEYL